MMSPYFSRLFGGYFVCHAPLQHGIAVHSVEVNRISDQKGGWLLVVSNRYQNPSGFSVNALKARASVLITQQSTDAQRRTGKFLLPESIGPSEFSAVRMP